MMIAIKRAGRIGQIKAAQLKRQKRQPNPSPGREETTGKIMHTCHLTSDFSSETSAR